jgi:polyphosphate kinase
LSLSGISGQKALGGSTAQQLLNEITAIVIAQQEESLQVLYRTAQ